MFQERERTQFVVKADEPGFYRVKAYLLDPPSLLPDKPWILLSKPTFAR